MANYLARVAAAGAGAGASPGARAQPAVQAPAMLPASETAGLASELEAGAGEGVTPVEGERHVSPTGPAASPAPRHSELAQSEADAGPADASRRAPIVPPLGVDTAVVRAPRALRPAQAWFSLSSEAPAAALESEPPSQPAGGGPREPGPGLPSAEEAQAPGLAAPLLRGVVEAPGRGATVVSTRGPREGPALEAPRGSRAAWPTGLEVEAVGVTPEAAGAEVSPGPTAAVAERAQPAAPANLAEHPERAEIPPATPRPVTAAPRQTHEPDRNQPPLDGQPAALRLSPPPEVAEHRGSTGQRRARVNIGRVEIQVTNQPPPAAPPTPAPASHDVLPQRLERQFLDRFSLLP